MNVQRAKFGSRLLDSVDDCDVFQHNAWDNVEWNEEQLNLAAEKVKKNSVQKMSIDESSKFDLNASDYWNKFYETHDDKFFKERNWLFIDFPELISNCSQAKQQVKFEREFHRPNDESSSEQIDTSGERSIDDEALIICEFGCGTGSTQRTILNVNTNSKTFVYCSDFSSKSIDILKKHSSYDEKRCHAFVFDFTDTEMKLPFGESSIDVMLMIFALSAINPKKMQSAIDNACKYLKPGGCFLFRDYGLYDMAQLRFKSGKCVADNQYVRGDGTFAYFFTEHEVEQLFIRTGLMRKGYIYVDRRLQTNRIKKLKMFRVYVQAKFIRL